MGDERSAWDTALNALSRRSYSLAEIARKLREKSFDPAEIDEVRERLVRLKLVDERGVAYNHAARRAEEGRRGRVRVRQEMLARGLDPALVDEALDEAFPAESERERFRGAVEKLMRGAPPPREPAKRQRLLRRLVRDGFPQGMIRELSDDWESQVATFEDEDDGLT
jgi:regulatory protein